MLYGHSENIDLSSVSVPFSWEEILWAIKHSPNNRSPGPDGFTNELFRAYASFMKEDLLTFFNEFFEHWVDLSGINIARICLLPKLDVPLEIMNYRPICLVQSLVKLLTKVLAIRLQQFITLLIQNMQSGFIKGRATIENLRIRACSMCTKAEIRMAMGSVWVGTTPFCTNPYP